MALEERYFCTNSAECDIFLIGKNYQQGKRPKDAGGTGTKAGLELGPDGRAFSV